jgi:hypothetical protein
MEQRATAQWNPRGNFGLIKSSGQIALFPLLVKYPTNFCARASDGGVEAEAVDLPGSHDGFSIGDMVKGLRYDHVASGARASIDKNSFGRRAPDTWRYFRVEFADTSIADLIGPSITLLTALCD